MAFYYYPSCKFTAALPEVSKAASSMVEERYGMTVMGCCRPNHLTMTAEDTAVTICNTCSAICEEDSPAQVTSIWEVIDRDPDFPFPDYHGEVMTLQDCWRCHDRRAEQEAVRSLLRKMNIQIVELPENFEKTRFCGITLHIPLPKSNGDLAPKRFIELADGMFVPKSPEEQERLMKAHCAAITTNKVVCYCTSCRAGILKGGKEAPHLMALLLGMA